MSPFGEDARVITDSKCSKCFYSVDSVTNEIDACAARSVVQVRLGFAVNYYEVAFLRVFSFSRRFSRIFFRV